MIIRLIIIVVLIQGSAAQKLKNLNYINIQTHKIIPIKKNCSSISWMDTYFCLARQFQIQFPKKQKAREKFIKYIILENQKRSFYQNTKISYGDMMRAYQIKNIVHDQSNQFLADLEYNLYQLKYNISQYDQLPFCVVVPSYQNVQNERYKKNLISILQQNYTNYHVVYMDDASPDQTSDYVNKFIEKHPLKNKIKVIRNQFNVGHLKNGLIAARNYCKPNQFYFRIDGDDYLVGKQVLKLFNAVHQQNSQAWAINSNSIVKQISGSPHLGLSGLFLEQVIQNNDYRYSPFKFFVQQSFYTELFLRIKDEDLRDESGEYYKYTGDAAYIWPILEMSGKRVHYIPQITYYYDYTTGMNEAVGKTLGIQVMTYVQLQHKQKYSILEQLFKQEDLPIKLKVSK